MLQLPVDSCDGQWMHSALMISALLIFITNILQKQNVSQNFLLYGVLADTMVCDKCHRGGQTERKLFWCNKTMFNKCKKMCFF